MLGGPLGAALGGMVGGMVVGVLASFTHRKPKCSSAVSGGDAMRALFPTRKRLEVVHRDELALL